MTTRSQHGQRLRPCGASRSGVESMGIIRLSLRQRAPTSSPAGHRSRRCQPSGRRRCHSKRRSHSERRREAPPRRHRQCPWPSRRAQRHLRLPPRLRRVPLPPHLRSSERLLPNARLKESKSFIVPSLRSSARYIFGLARGGRELRTGLPHCPVVGFASCSLSATLGLLSNRDGLRRRRRTQSGGRSSGRRQSSGGLWRGRSPAGCGRGRGPRRCCSSQGVSRSETAGGGVSRSVEARSSAIRRGSERRPLNCNACATLERR
jgi:hypothetical protein